MQARGLVMGSYTMAVVAVPPPGQHVTNDESRCGTSRTLTHVTCPHVTCPCGIQHQIWAFNAATAKALTTVLAGFAFTIVSLPNITFLVALVAGFFLVLIMQRPGRVNLPTFFTSAVPTSANDIRSLVTTAFFSSQPVASASARAPLLMAFAAAFIAFGAMAIFWGRFCKARTKLRA